MGIPRLTSQLQPYAGSAVLGCKTSQCSEHQSNLLNASEKKIVIDGPGLAFHIFYSLLACKSLSLNAFDAAPSYAEIGRGVTAFLEELRLYGLKMYTILNISIGTQLKHIQRKNLL